jgi:hypothetical protein
MVDIDTRIPLTREAVVASPTDARVAELEVGSVGETVAGAAGLILAILALLGVLPATLAAVAAIALGAGLLIGGATLARRYAQLVPAVMFTRAREEIAGALGLQALAGVAGIVLGILALLGGSFTLLSVAAIVFGAALLAAGSGLARLTRSARWFRTDTMRSADEGGYAAAGWEALVGLGAAVLGILALTGHDPAVLTYVALLCVGAAAAIGGSLLTARLFSVFG